MLLDQAGATLLREGAPVIETCAGPEIRNKRWPELRSGGELQDPHDEGGGGDDQEQEKHRAAGLGAALVA